MKAMLLVTAAALAFSGSAFAADHNFAAAGARGTAHQRVIHAPPKGSTTLYDQNIGDGSYGWFSQTLSSYPQYNEYLADDFVVPAGHVWKIKEVDTTGFYYIEAGPASSVNVLIWNDKKGLPSTKNGPAVECDNLTPNDNAGSFQIKLPKSCSVKLKGGKSGKRYWLTVQANMAGPGTSGYWAWLSNTSVANNEGAGYYYGGGGSVADQRCLTQFETISDCNAWTPIDLAFAIQGKDVSK